MRLISCHSVMSKIYIRKISWEQDWIKESGVTTQGRGEVELGIFFLGNDKNDVFADKVLRSYF